ncbi:probable E3 ubiquitin-protein ligase ZFP1 isoform X3 [Dendrobium catenatum]|uniref:probable E3 ubiquitin-protein ligase ZFP1 isoform X3 n=1 Tax=Dendrobium catenatum TaxID=906689 RepID=UPI00109F3676|nr:probable E3 ubiquitin-protein ligase ZFP1 isoform X3 [Dendrobium catenatum]
MRIPVASILLVFHSLISLYMEWPPFTMVSQCSFRPCFHRIKVGKIMEPRNIFYASPLPEFHHVHLLNPPNVNPQRHIGSTMLGSNEHTIMNYSVNFRHQNTTNSGAICDNYQHPVFTVSSNHKNPCQTQNVPYCYNQLANQTGTTIVYPPAESSRMAFKRKTPAHPVYENPYRYQFTGSSSNFPVPPNHFQLETLPVCSRPLQPNGSVYGYHQDETRLSVGEEYPRNVRIRHGNAPQAGLNPAWQSSSSRPTQRFHSSTSISASTVAGGQWHHNAPPGTYSQWNHPTTADAGCSNNLMNQYVLRNCVFGGDAEQNSTWNSDNGRNSYARVPNPQPSDAQDAWAGSVSVSSSSIPRLNILQNSSTNRVPRNFNATFIMGNAQRGWTSQSLPVMDVPPPAYAFDSLDEHRGLRLDIDNMSYEELLMLEETIGNVNTGLSEDQLSRCLTERIHCSSASAQDDQDETSCPICLEEFKDEDSQGVMKCQHVYHATCIKKWLGLKKTCPICKALAVDDDVKQKQKVSL